MNLIRKAWKKLSAETKGIYLKAAQRDLQRFTNMEVSRRKTESESDCKKSLNQKLYLWNNPSFLDVRKGTSIVNNDD